MARILMVLGLMLPLLVGCAPAARDISVTTTALQGEELEERLEDLGCELDDLELDDLELEDDEDIDELFDALDRISLDPACDPYFDAIIDAVERAFENAGYDD